MVSRLPVIDADGEVSDLSNADPALFRPFSELPASLKAKLPGRPRKDNPKVFTGIRLDADILDAFKATGKGWQTRMNDALRDWLKAHPAG